MLYVFDTNKALMTLEIAQQLFSDTFLKNLFYQKGAIVKRTSFLILFNLFI